MIQLDSKPTDIDFKQHSTTKDLAGKKFGRLTVLYLAGYTRKRRAAWMCLCDCGNQKLVRHGCLDTIYKPTRSCGCLLKDIGRAKCAKINSKLIPGRAGYNQVYCNYKYNANKRKYNFQITEFQAKELFIGNCFYCDAPPLQGTDEFRYNGIDRVDNTIGYVEGNCVACCGRCNKAKHVATIEEFKDYIKRVYNNLWKLEEHASRVMSCV